MSGFALFLQHHVHCKLYVVNLERSYVKYPLSFPELWVCQQLHLVTINLWRFTMWKPVVTIICQSPADNHVVLLVKNPPNYFISNIHLFTFNNLRRNIFFNEIEKWSIKKFMVQLQNIQFKIGQLQQMLNWSDVEENMEWNAFV